MAEIIETDLRRVISIIDQTLVALARRVFLAKRFPKLLSALREKPSIMAALKSSEITDHTRTKTRLNAIAASAIESRHLRIRERNPLLQAFAINTDAVGRPYDAYGTPRRLNDLMDTLNRGCSHAHFRSLDHLSSERALVRSSAARKQAKNPGQKTG